MKLKNQQYQLDIRVDLCEGGMTVSLPVEVTDQSLANLGIEGATYIEIRKFVITDKNELLKLISGTIDLFYRE